MTASKPLLALAKLTRGLMLSTGELQKVLLDFEDLADSQRQAQALALEPAPKLQPRRFKVDHAVIQHVLVHLQY